MCCSQLLVKLKFLNSSFRPYHPIWENEPAMEDSTVWFAALVGCVDGRIRVNRPSPIGLVSHYRSLLIVTMHSAVMVSNCRRNTGPNILLWSRLSRITKFCCFFFADSHVGKHFYWKRHIWRTTLIPFNWPMTVLSPFKREAKSRP